MNPDELNKKQKEISTVTFANSINHASMGDLNNLTKGNPLIKIITLVTIIGGIIFAFLNYS